jgi:hypothetical protein
VFAVVEKEAAEVEHKMAVVVVVAVVHLSRGGVVVLVGNLIAHKDTA